MKKLLNILHIFILLGISGCTLNSSKPPFLPVNDNEVLFRKGDCLQFEIDSVNKGVLIVTGYRKYPNSLWYGLVFTNYRDSVSPVPSEIKKLKVFGRRVQSPFEEIGFYVGLDYDYLLDSCLKANSNRFKLICHLALNDKKLLLGSEGATDNYKILLQSFFSHLKERTSETLDNNSQNKKNQNYLPGELYPLDDFINKN